MLLFISESGDLHNLACVLLSKLNPRCLLPPGLIFFLSGLFSLLAVISSLTFMDNPLDLATVLTCNKHHCQQTPNKPIQVVWVLSETQLMKTIKPVISCVRRGWATLHAVSKEGGFTSELLCTDLWLVCYVGFTSVFPSCLLSCYNLITFHVMTCYKWFWQNFQWNQNL